MQLTIDRERCVGAGMCALTAPEVFDQDDEDGRVLLRMAAPPPGLRATARLAAGLCPAAAVTVTDTDTDTDTDTETETETDVETGIEADSDTETDVETDADTLTEQGDAGGSVPGAR